MTRGPNIDRLGPDELPLTPMQVAMVAEGVASGRPWLNLQQVICRLEPDVGQRIHPEHLRAAWLQVQQRHQSLRSSIDWNGSAAPRQRVVESAPVEIEHIPLTVDDDDSRQRFEEWLAADRARGIDLGAAPAMRLAWFAGSRGDSDAGGPPVLVWTFHHAMVDGRSQQIVVRELLDTLDHLALGEPPPMLAPAPALAGHRAAVLERDHDADARFYAEHLGGLSERVDLARAFNDLDTDESLDARHGIVDVEVGAELVDRLTERSRGVGTLGSALAAAWAVLLSRYTGQGDVCFGSTRSGRYAVDGDDGLVGCLITTIPMRVRPAPHTTVDELMAGVRAFQLAARGHEHASMVDIQRVTDVPAGSRLFDTVLVFERQLLDVSLRAAGGRWARRRFEVREESGVPLTVAVYGDGSDLRVTIDYDTDRYEHADVERLARHFANLLTSIAGSDSDTPICELDMLDVDERRAALVHGGAVLSAREVGTWCDQFAVAVSAHHDHTAVVDASGASLRYDELDERSRALAAALAALGAGTEAVVAVCVPRSVHQVVALTGVLRSGAAFLPLDPTYPVKTRQTKMAAAGVCVLIAGQAEADELLADGGFGHVSVLLVDEWPQSADAADELPGVAPRDLAYIVFTSGSTGEPKGVMVQHGALGAYCAAVNRSYDLRPDDRVLQFASASFDVAIEEILAPLCVGACVVMRSSEIAESMDELLAASKRHRITVLNLPSAFWHDLVRHYGEVGEATMPSTVRLVVVGGEKASRWAYERWVESFPDLAWVNAYGPTETTVTCLVHPGPSAAELTGLDEIPIGRPLANTRAYVLAPDRTPSPPEVAGELWIGGASVARGYVGREQLSSERFVTDPFAREPGARMYRTGDRARLLASGELEFLGRVDRQVKVRGFRIEPREIEAVLERHPDVAQAFVATRDGPTGEAMTVAWIVSSNRAVADPVAVREFAASEVPHYLVPGAIVLVDDLPYTPSGKVDAAALPSPVHDAPGAKVHDELLRPDVATMMRFFSEVLGGVDVGPDDSFFELGGHSLLAVQLMAKTGAAFTGRLTLGMLHQHPTPRRLVDSIDNDSLERYRYLVGVQPFGSRPPMFGVHVLGKNQGFYRPLADRLGPDQPVYSLGFVAPDDAAPRTVPELAAAYVNEIERFAPDGPVALAGVSLGGYVAFEAALQLQERDREIALLVLFDAAGPAGRTERAGVARLAVHWRLARADGWRAPLQRKLQEWSRRVRGNQPTTDEAGDALDAYADATERAVRSYRPRRFDGTMVVLHASESPFDRPDIGSTGFGWAGHATRVDVVDVPGGHISMLEEPHVGAVAAEVAARLSGRAR